MTTTNQLTEAERVELAKYSEVWKKHALCCEPADFDTAEKAVLDVYRISGLKAPEVIIRAESTIDGLNKIIELGAKHGLTDKAAIQQNYEKCRMYGQYYAPITGFVVFYRDVMKAKFEELELTYADEALAKSCAAVHFFDDAAVIINRPLHIRLDNMNLLHSSDEMAIKFRDGVGMYIYHGMNIEARYGKFFKNHDLITPDVIDGETNVEMRRVLLELSGFERYLTARKAKLIDEDKDVNGNPRRLLEFTVGKDTRDQFTARVMEVNNGSLEPDGSRRKFILGAVRNPRTREWPTTCHEAVAYSYGRPANKYKEQVRT